MANKTIYDLIIVGAGPAGISAAIYAARKKIKFLLLGETTGGLIAKISLIENYPGFWGISGKDLIDKFYSHLKVLGIMTRNEQVDKIAREKNIFSVQTAQETYSSKTVLYAAGAQPKLLNIPGEARFAKKGISYCAICDAPLFEGQDIAIVGGGNAGMETALQVLPYAKKIYILESTARVTADQLLVEKVSNHKQIILLPGAKIQKVGGSDFVEEILFEQSGRQQKLSVQGILINVGYESHVLPVDQLVALNNKREIIVDKWQKTNQLGFFAAGACTDSPYKQIITAAGDGCRAALSAFDYLSDIEPSK